MVNNLVLRLLCDGGSLRGLGIKLVTQDYCVCSAKKQFKECGGEVIAAHFKCLIGTFG